MNVESAFGRLYEALENREKLPQAYDSLLDELFRNDFWKDGPIELHRVIWTCANEARSQDRKTFDSPGLYIWGIDNRPLYIGITRTAFRRRFGRYIWQDRSQCKLAKDYATDLTFQGIDGFPADIRDWYKRSFRGSRVRLEGAVRFAREGIDKIWFSLLPLDQSKGASLEEIRKLERALIPVAEEWNEKHQYCRLLNLAP